jgi:threonine/homoserine/homoserine lactone efflux protein
MSDWEAWAALLGLGAFHGINPGMGWLFAVALGLQEGRRRAVFRALIPIALGHALSIGAVVLIVALAQAAIPMEWLACSRSVRTSCFGCDTPSGWA